MHDLFYQKFFLDLIAYKIYQEGYYSGSVSLCPLVHAVYSFWSESKLTTKEKVVYLHEFIQFLEYYLLKDFAQNRIKRYGFYFGVVDIQLHYTIIYTQVTDIF